VLWLIVLLSVVAAGHARNVHTETRLARHQLEIAKARALAEAGTHRAVMELLVRNTDSPWPVNGTVSTIFLDESRVTITIRDARGLVDLNGAGVDLLRATFAAAGIDKDRSRRIVDATLDWRDQDSLKLPYGAEDSDYQTAGLEWTARDGKFTSVDELRYVIGMNDEIFEMLAPFLTVYSGSPGLNLEFAPPLLVGALTGKTVVPADNLPGDEPPTANPGGRTGTYHINVEVARSDGTVAWLEAVVQVSSASEQPYKVLHWRIPMKSPLKVAG